MFKQSFALYFIVNILPSFCFNINYFLPYKIQNISMNLTQMVQILKNQFIDKVQFSSSLDAVNTLFSPFVHVREIYCRHRGKKAPLRVLI